MVASCRPLPMEVQLSDLFPFSQCGIYVQKGREPMRKRESGMSKMTGKGRLAQGKGYRCPSQVTESFIFSVFTFPCQRKILFKELRQKMISDTYTMLHAHIASQSSQHASQRFSKGGIRTFFNFCLIYKDAITFHLSFFLC